MPPATHTHRDPRRAKGTWGPQNRGGGMGLLDGPWGLPEEVPAPQNQLEAPRSAPWDTPTAEKVLHVAACAPTHTFSPPWAFRSSAQLGYNRPSQGGKTRAAPQHAPPVPTELSRGLGGRGGAPMGGEAPLRRPPVLGGICCARLSPLPLEERLWLVLWPWTMQGQHPRGGGEGGPGGDLGCQRTAGTRQAVSPSPLRLLCPSPNQEAG